MLSRQWHTDQRPPARYLLEEQVVAEVVGADKETRVVVVEEVKVLQDPARTSWTPP